MSLLDDLAAIAKRASCDEWCSVDNCAVFRIRAALADHEHLEEGARLLAVDGLMFAKFTETEMIAHWAAMDAWLAAEAKRKDETNG